MLLKGMTFQKLYCNTNYFFNIFFKENANRDNDSNNNTNYKIIQTK